MPNDAGKSIKIGGVYNVVSPHQGRMFVTPWRNGEVYPLDCGTKFVLLETYEYIAAPDRCKIMHKGGLATCMVGSVVSRAKLIC